jgi:hypothetical protein
MRFYKVERQTRFKIVFEKLAEGQWTGGKTQTEMADSEKLCAESEEIAEVRRAINEITDTEPESFTQA